MSKNQSKKKRGQYQVILIDDNFNTFDHVIDCLIEICGHNYYQAVQCATITHNAKQCSIIIDSWDVCQEVYEDLIKQGLTVTVTKHEKTI
jgi:ATP-dependent Clp protease adaptor protein ClpS